MQEVQGGVSGEGAVGFLGIVPDEPGGELLIESVEVGGNGVKFSPAWRLAPHRRLSEPERRRFFGEMASGRRDPVGSGKPRAFSADSAPKRGPKNSPLP